MKETEKIKTLERNNLILVGVIIILSGLLIYNYARIEALKTTNEDLCYLSNNLIDLVNQIKNIGEIDYQDLPNIQCDSGNAERRFTDG